MARSASGTPTGEIASRILWEDNHLIAVNKRPGELVQGDKTGDTCLLEQLREFIRVREAKPGETFMGLVHRLDRPTSGCVLFARTSKALSRMNAALRERAIRKIYWVAADGVPDGIADSGADGGWLTLEDWLLRDPKQNRSRAVPAGTAHAKQARMRIRVRAAGRTLYLLEAEIETGRHHQIRAQLAARGIHCHGDVKYGARRGLPDRSIGLHARALEFEHPVRRQLLRIEAPAPDSGFWSELSSGLTASSGWK